MSHEQQKSADNGRFLSADNIGRLRLRIEWREVHVFLFHLKTQTK